MALRIIIGKVFLSFSVRSRPVILFTRLRFSEYQSQLNSSANRTKSMGKVLLSAPIVPSLASTKRLVREKNFDFNSFSVDDIVHRFPTFTDTEWSEYLGLISANPRRGLLLPLRPRMAAPVSQIRDGACYWLAKRMDNLQPIDYFNLLRYLNAIHHFYSMLFRVTPWERHRFALSSSAQHYVFEWFRKNYETLQSSDFFEILKCRREFVVLHKLESKEKLEDILNILAHGVKLAENGAEIRSILQLLYTVALYVQIFDKNDSIFASFSKRLMETLKTREVPENRFDLLESLAFLSDKSRSVRFGRENIITYRAVFRRHANGNYTAWKWLRNSIEIVFENDEFADMRQTAAVAAVRAYKWKAVDFSPDDVERYLQKAAEPFTANLPIFFEPTENEFSANMASRLSSLITAIRSAAVSDLPQLGKMTIRLDDAFWDRFFEVVRKEGPNLGRRMRLLTSLRKILSNVHPILPEEKPFLCLELTDERVNLMCSPKAVV